MKRLVNFATEDGGKITVEVDDPSPTQGLERTSRGGAVAVEASQTFEAAMTHLRSMTSAMMTALRELNNPDEVELEFGIKLNAEAGVILASASAEANIGVKLAWKRVKSGEGHAAPTSTISG